MNDRETVFTIEIIRKIIQATLLIIKFCEKKNESMQTRYNQ